MQCYQFCPIKCMSYPCQPRFNFQSSIFQFILYSTQHRFHFQSPIIYIKSTLYIVENNSDSIGLVHSCKTYIRLGLRLVQYKFDSCVLVRWNTVLYSIMYTGKPHNFPTGYCYGPGPGRACQSPGNNLYFSGCRPIQRVDHYSFTSIGIQQSGYVVSGESQQLV